MSRLEEWRSIPMKNRLQEIKNEFAKTLEFEDWNDLRSFHILEDVPGLEEIESDVIATYTEECIKASLEKASKRAFMNLHDGTTKTNKSTQYYQIGADNLQVDKESITNEENIVIL